MNIIKEIANILEKEGIDAPDSIILAEKIYDVIVHTYPEGFQVTSVSLARRRVGIRKLLVEHKVKNISGILEQIENLNR